MSTVRRTVLAVAAVLAVTIAAGACSREPAVDDASSTSTALDGTTSSTSDTLASTDTTAPPDSTDTTDSTTSTTTGDEVGVFGHTDAELASFRAAYAAAFDAECRRIWSSYAGGDGLMADPDFPEDTYTVDDCLTELDDENGEFTDSVAEAQSTGVDDAQIAASDLADPLCATGGTPCWSYGDN